MSKARGRGGARVPTPVMDTYNATPMVRRPRPNGHAEGAQP